MSAGVGADVESLCSKCGDVWHVVVAKDGDKIVKVQCKQCSGYHRYKSPHGAPPVKKLRRRIAHRRSHARRRDPVERFEKPAVARICRSLASVPCEREVRVGERMDHPSFGQGIVEISEPGKVTVFFATGRRVLAQPKDAVAKAVLERPKPFDHSKPTPGGKPVGER